MHGTPITLARAPIAALCAVVSMTGNVRADGPAQSSSHVSALQVSADPTGVIGTLDRNGPPDAKGAFFQSLGTNGRSCATCHVASQGMSLDARAVRDRFAQTRGRDPLFDPVDGANCPNAREGNPADHSLLLEHGVIRIFLQMPTNPEFSISVVHDPYGCALVPDPNGGPPFVSVYRRPLPTANLRFLSTIMFDGRETHEPLNDATSFTENLGQDLTQQAVDAVITHAEASHAPSAAQLADIVGFELGLYTAQLADSRAGVLGDADAAGGPVELSSQAYHPGINDSLGADPQGAPFDPASMTLFAAWSALPYESRDPGEILRDAARRDIAAGETLFNTAPVHISNVRGLNDNAALGFPSVFTGTCTTCHDTPNTGNHSFPLPLDIGTSHSTLSGTEKDPNVAAGLAELSMPDLPVYRVRGCPNPFDPGEPESFYTSDPGKALISGSCSDFNRGKGPILRGLAARAPYFHNGAAASLEELVNFYDQRFQMKLTEAQKRELVAFLDSL
jgi:cytochrome c peroxidase